MPQFSPDYVRLCRRLRLEREFAWGDVYLGRDDHQHIWGVERYLPEHAGDGLVWLPAAADWIPMLTERTAGSEVVVQQPDIDDEPVDRWEARSWEHSAAAPTLEEALAQLWIVVVGRLLAPERS